MRRHSRACTLHNPGPARLKPRATNDTAPALVARSFSSARYDILHRRRFPVTDAPKSAFELAMERLKRKDAEAGVTEAPLTDEQRAAIAEARSVYQARVAERRIMHESALASTFDPAERAQRDEEFRRDLERFESDRDAKIRRIREGA